MDNKINLLANTPDHGVQETIVQTSANISLHDSVASNFSEVQKIRKKRKKVSEEKRHSVAYKKYREKANVRNRKYLSKLTDAQREERNRKKRESYQRKKDLNLVKGINDLTSRQQRHKRKYWREASAKSRKQKQQLEDTPRTQIKSEPSCSEHSEVAPGDVIQRTPLSSQKKRGEKVRAKNRARNMQEPREEGDGEESQATASPWKPNEEYLKILTGMGISRVAAEKALFYTDNRSPDLAAAWIFENSEGDLETSLEAEANERSEVSYGDAYKMAFVVNMSLDMGTGKLASQVAHAAIGMHRLLLQNENKYGEMVLQWSEDGETKIVLRGTTTQHLVELERKALRLGLPTYLVQDAGRTQIAAGSTTVLCLMGRLDVVDQVTGSLKLL